METDMETERIDPKLDETIQHGIARFKEGNIRRDRLYENKLTPTPEFTKMDREWMLEIGRQAAIDQDLGEQRILAEKSARKSFNAIATEATLF